MLTSLYSCQALYFVFPMSVLSFSLSADWLFWVPVWLGKSFWRQIFVSISSMATSRGHFLLASWVPGLCILFIFVDSTFPWHNLSISLISTFSAFARLYLLANASSSRPFTMKLLSMPYCLLTSVIQLDWVALYFFSNLFYFLVTLDAISLKVVSTCCIHRTQNHVMSVCLISSCCSPVFPGHTMQKYLIHPNTSAPSSSNICLHILHSHCFSSDSKSDSVA